MTFSCHQDDIPRLSQDAGSPDRFPSVHDGQYASTLFLGQSCQHIVDNLLRILESRVVTGDNHTVTVLDSFLRHQRTLTLISVATSATYRPTLTAMFQYLVDGIQHIFQCIGCMGIIHNGSHTALGTDCLESAVYRFQGTQVNQCFPWLCPHHDSCSVDSQQVAHVEASHKLYTNLLTVNLQIHALEALLQNLSLEVCGSSCRVSLYLSLRVLHHYKSVLVIGIGDSKGSLGQ